ncbi:MAG: class IV adenylate cyclase [Planctomycetes bacterium]|nr:class IV adenylate cyclase [Planctomycetota bacterium]
MLNIEIKARLRDRGNVEARLEALGARRMWTLRQKDTFFAVPSGWLKIREAEGRPPEVISYRRATSHAGPRASDFDVILVEDAAAWKRLLGRVVPADKVVAKERTLWIYEHTRIHLDRVEGLGDFLELETVVDGITSDQARAETSRLVETLGIKPADLVAAPYRDLVK